MATTPFCRMPFLHIAQATACALAIAGAAQPQSASAADLSGTYRCAPNPDPCLWSGPTATVTQTGSKLQIKGGNGAVADATLTSSITISAGGTFNSLGIVRPDGSIDWSDGTKWRRN